MADANGKEIVEWFKPAKGRVLVEPVRKSTGNIIVPDGKIIVKCFKVVETCPDDRKEHQWRVGDLVILDMQTANRCSRIELNGTEYTIIPAGIIEGYFVDTPVNTN